jgi:hypothetical protein
VFKCSNYASAREIRASIRSTVPGRYGHLVAKSQIVIFVMVKLGNFASRKVNLDPRFWMINRNFSTGGGGSSYGKRDTKSSAIGRMV